MTSDSEHQIHTITFPNGQKYVGEMKNGKMHGKGKMSSPDGPTYEGDWVNGVMHGYGVLTWPGGNKEAGWWEKGNFKGEEPPSQENLPFSKFPSIPTNTSPSKSVGSSVNFEASYDYTIKKGTQPLSSVKEVVSSSKPSIKNPSPEITKFFDYDYTIKKNVPPSSSSPLKKTDAISELPAIKPIVEKNDIKPPQNHSFAPSSVNFETSYDYTIKKSSTTKPILSNPVKPSPSAPSLTPVGASGSFDYKVKKSSPLKDILPTPKSFSLSHSKETKSEETVFAPDVDLNKLLPPESKKIVLSPPSSSLTTLSSLEKKLEPAPKLTATEDKSEMKTITFPNGQKYVGEMKNGKMHGKGKMSSPDGPTYEGDWVNGVMHGYGVLTWPGGNKEAGWWEKGNFKGEEPPKTL